MDIFFKTKAASMFRLTCRGLQESKIFDCDNKRLGTCNYNIKKWNKSDGTWSYRGRYKNSSKTI